MRYYNKNKAFVFFLFLTSCSASTIYIDEQTDLSEYRDAKWAITKSGSIIKFDNGIDGFAAIEDSVLSFRVNKDSTKVYDLKDFKTIYAQKDVTALNYIVGGVFVAAAILGYFFHGINLSGG